MDNFSPTDSAPQPAPQTAPPPAAPRPNRTWIIAGAGGVLALCCCGIIAIGALLWFDPFNWGLLTFLRGGDPLAANVPADVMVYASLDVTQLNTPEMQYLVEAFAGISETEPLTTTQDMLKQLDDTMREDLGITVTDDVLPWVGRYLAVAVTEVQLNPLGESTGDFVVLVEARDPAKTQAFLTRYTEAVAQNSDTPFTTSEYAGVTLYTQPQETTDPLVVAHSKNLFLFGNSLTAMQSILDTQAGKAPTLSQDPAFTALIAQAPKNRLLNAYLPGSAFTTLMEQSQRAQNLSLPQMQDSLAALKGMALFVSIINEGVRIDSAAQYDESLLGAEQAALIKHPTTSTALERLPEGTLLYALSQRPDVIWKAYKDGMESIDPGTFNDAMTSFENQFGFNPDVDLLPFLTGELALAVVPDENSLLAQSGQINLGLALLAQSADDVALREALDKFNALQADTGATIETETLGGIEAHLFGFGPGEPMAVYGAGQSWLTIATSPEVFAATYAPTASLAASAEHQALWASFPTGTRPAFFMDVRGLMTLAQDSDLDNFVPVDEEVLKYIAPFRAMASGAQPFAQGMLRSTAIIFIEKPTE